MVQFGGRGGVGAESVGKQRPKLIECKVVRMGNEGPAVGSSNLTERVRMINWCVG